MRILALGLLLAWTPVPASGQEEPALFVEGRLLFAGRPLSEATTAQPRLWFLNEDTNRGHKSDIHPEVSDQFVTAGLEPGRYMLSAYVDADPVNPTRQRNYPGDYYGGAVFTVPAEKPITVTMRRIIHLTAPQDSAEVLSACGARCEDKPDLPGPMVFSWEPLGPEVRYAYSVEKIRCPYDSQGEVRSGDIWENSVALVLPPSAPDEFYLFKLEASRRGLPIGGLMTRGERAECGDFRFRVR